MAVACAHTVGSAVPGLPVRRCGGKPTFLRSTVFCGENDENRQDEKNLGPCRFPSHHHYRSAHSSLQSECILLAAAEPGCTASTCAGNEGEKI